jgi:hypothetical protein
MTRTEDLLRAATKHAAAQIHPSSITPLDPATLAAPRRHGGNHVPARRPRRRLQLALPLAAAAAVAGLSVGLHLALDGIAGPGAVPGPSGKAPRASSGTVPAFYAALTGTTNPSDESRHVITIRSTMTGAVLATVTPPSGYGTFALVAPGQNDEEFIVGAQPWQPVSNSAVTDDNNWAPVTLLMLHFDPATQAVSFSPLPGPKVDGRDVQGVALSPDGTQLAVAAQVSADEQDLSMYSLSGGGVRTWSVTGAGASQDGFGIWPSLDSLWWQPDGKTLAFDWAGANSTVIGVRLLDTSQPGGSLLADSRPVFTLPDGPGDGRFLCTDRLVLSPDGTTVTCAGSVLSTMHPGTSTPIPKATTGASPAVTRSTLPPGTNSSRVIYGFGEFSVATGKLITIIDPTIDHSDLGVNQQLFWTNGSSLIGTLDGPVFIFQGRAVKNIPWNSHISPGLGGGANEAAW